MTVPVTAIATLRPGVTLRPASRDDVPLILALIRELAEYEREPDAVQTDEAMLAANLFGDAPGAEVVIADVDGRPAGFALFFHNFSTWLGRRGLYLDDLFVRPEHRGRGVGQVRMTYLAKLAVERGCGRFEWWVLDWNTPALDFYRRLGAAPMDEWTVQRVSGDAVLALAASFAPRD